MQKLLLKRPKTLFSLSSYMTMKEPLYTLVATKKYLPAKKKPSFRFTQTTGYMHSGAITEDGLYVWGASYGDAIPFPEKVTFISPPGYERTPISVLMNPSSMDSYVLTKEGYFYEISIQNQGSITKPDKIKNLSLSDQGDGLVTITIASADDAQGYEIAYSANKKFLKAQTNQKLVSAKSTNGKSVIKLKKGSAYYIRARAFRKDSDGNNIYGAYSDTKKIKPKK